MEFFNIGGGELLIIVLLALILFGPEDIMKIMRTVGKYMKTAQQMWSQFTSTVQEEYLAAQELEQALTETQASVAEAQKALEDVKTSVEETTATVQKDVAEAQRSLRTQAAESAASLRKATTVKREPPAQERVPKPVPVTKPWLNAPLPPSPSDVLVSMRGDPALSPKATREGVEPSAPAFISAESAAAPTPAAAPAQEVSAEVPVTAEQAASTKPWRMAPLPPSPETVVVDVRRDPAFSPPVWTPTTAPKAAPTPEDGRVAGEGTTSTPVPQTRGDGATPPLSQMVPVSSLPDPAFGSRSMEAATPQPVEASIGQRPVGVDLVEAPAVEAEQTVPESEVA